MHDASGDITSEVLTAFVAGQLDPAHERRVREWAASDAANQARLDELRELWQLSAKARPEWDPEAALERVKSATTPAATTPAAATSTAPAAAPLRRPSRSMPQRRTWVGPALKAAAIAAVLAGGVWLARPWLDSPPSQPAAAERVYTSERGRRLAVHLPDGSAVMLAPESRLRVLAGYGARARAVELEGDAAFEVPHDESVPFIVHAADVVVRDLGTRFVVRARAELPDAEVYVAEGSVMLKLAQPATPDSLLLLPSDLGRATADGRLTRRRGVSADRYLGWTEGRLVYDRARLADVVVDLDRWYDVDITLADPGLGDRQLSATFDENDIGQVLAMISAALRLDVTRDGRRIVLSAANGGEN